MQEQELDLEYLQNTHIHICMPCYGGQVTDVALISIINWSNVCREHGIRWSIDIISNESLIPRARNYLVAKFLNSPESTHLMFIDADIGWEPWHLLLLIDAKKDVIGGLYTLKKFPAELCVNVDKKQLEDSPSDLVEVLRTGTGFLLIKREVFDKLNSHRLVVPYKSDVLYDSALLPYTKTYFDTGVHDGRYFSEDWLFCENWRDLGGQVYIDRRVLLKHKGSFVFEPKAQDDLYVTLQEVYEPKNKGTC